MSAPLTFSELIERVRRGQEDATTELLRRYEPALRRVIRVRLFDVRVRRLHDGDDICQSVFASFFVRLALGQYEFDTPEALIRLLGTMARNKIVDKGRRSDREGRADQRVPLEELPDEAVASPDKTPSQVAALRELLQEARRRLNPEERQILDFREQGLEWTDIAARVGGHPEAVRKRLSRAAALVAKELGLPEGD